MKVVLFCGGRGLRLREYSDKLPKPMIPIGEEPVLLHLMRYYAHFGHTEFVLCLGYQGHKVRSHFESLGAVTVPDGASDAVLDPAVARMRLGTWSLTFVQTDVEDTIGDRLRKARPFVEDDELFLANYSDDLADAPLDVLIENMRSRPDVVGSFLSVKPNLSLHCVDANADGTVTGVSLLRDRGLRVNGGYFVFRRAIFDVLLPGDELVLEPFARLIERRALIAHEHVGFWGPLDTLKDHQYLEELDAGGAAPWKVWERSDEADASAREESSTEGPVAVPSSV